MGIFSQKPKFKVAAPTIRKVVVPVDVPKPKPKVRPRSATPHSNSPSVRPSASGRPSKTPSASPRISASPAARKSRSPYPSSADEIQKARAQLHDRKRKLSSAATHRASPVSDRIEFDKDSESDDNDWEATLNAHDHRKRARLDEPVDLSRHLAHPALMETLSGDKETATKDTPKPTIIHAANVACRSLKCVPVIGATDDEVSVELQYPGSRHRERYELVCGKDKIDAVKDIKKTVQFVAEVYLTDKEAVPFLDPTTGIVRQLERASSDTVKDAKKFVSALDDYNKRLCELHNSGAIAANIAQQHSLPRDLTGFILDQVYDRTVAPKVELLRKYENGTDNVYGELLHPFITDILVDRLQMTSGQLFVDLGSGVGNVVLQAALEIGCESWGCEMMENACNLAEAQKKEFTERCRLWGVAPGCVHLERGDFRSNESVQAVLKRADVVLVNNQAFTSQLNDDLVRMFLDFKSGCKIVSLKSFVHDHNKSAHNINDVGSTILDVEDIAYPEGYVSWTGAAGKFCISTRR